MTGCASGWSALHSCGWRRFNRGATGFAYRRWGRAHRAIGVIVPRTRGYLALLSSTPMRFSKSTASEKAGWRGSFARSSKHTCAAGAWSTASFGSSARTVVTSTGWRLAVSAAAGAHRGAWPRAARTGSTTCYPGHRTASGWCRSPGRYACCSRPMHASGHRARQSSEPSGHRR